MPQKKVRKTKELSPNASVCSLESYLSPGFELGSYVVSSDTASASRMFDFVCEGNNGSFLKDAFGSVSKQEIIRRSLLPLASTRSCTACYNR